MTGNASPIIMPPRQQSTQIQVVPKHQIDTQLINVAVAFSKAKTTLLESVAATKQIRDMVEFSSQAIAQASLLGNPIDRSTIAGKDEVVALDQALGHLRSLINRITASIDVTLRGAIREKEGV